MQRRAERAGAKIAVPARLRWREVDDQWREAAEPGQRGRTVEVCRERQRARVAKGGEALRRMRDRVDAVPRTQQADQPQAHIAAANN